MKKDKEIISLKNEILNDNNEKEMLNKEIEDKMKIIEKEKKENMRLRNEVKMYEEIKSENESLRVYTYINYYYIIINRKKY